MNNFISKMQVRQAKFDSSKMTDLNHWSKNMAIKPEVFGPAQRELFSSKTNSVNLGQGNILESIFGLGKTKYIDDLTWSWKTKAAAFKPITILELRTPGDTPGKYRRPIKVLVDENFASLGESWWPGASDKSQVAVVKSIKKEARGVELTLQTSTEGAEHFIDPVHLEPGTAWTRAYTQRGEAAQSGGGLERGTDIEFRNNLVKLRKQFDVTDFAAQAVLEIAFKDANGKTHTSWMDMQEADYLMEMNKEVTKYALYSRLSDDPLIDPDSNYPINPGAGLHQQIEFGGNTEYYTTLTAELIEAFFDKIVYSRISPGDLGEVVGLSGHYGMKMFAKALDVWSGGRAIVRETNILDRTDPKGVHNLSLRAGYQYTVYDLPNGGSFRLIHNPLADDKTINREVDPLTGIPIESQRITILDVTGGNGASINTKDNIKLVRKNKVQGTTIIEGRVGPGGTISKNPTHSGDYYSVHYSDSVGIEIEDPTVTGELIKAVQRY